MHVWEKMEKFASYAFNRSHAACYAWIAYITAYMACHWTPEFYCAMMNAFEDIGDKVKGYLAVAALNPFYKVKITYKTEQDKIKLNIESLAIYKNIGGIFKMLYPFMTLNDNTEIVHSEILENSGKEEVEVRIEKPVEGGFYSATCWLPEYRWENIQGFSQEDIHYFQELLESVAHIILQLAREG